jgi:hypothetical protein
LPDVTIRRPSLFLLRIRLVQRTLVVRFQWWFPSPFCFLIIYKSLESLLRTFIFFASSSSCFLFSFTFSKKSLTSFRRDPSTLHMSLPLAFSLLTVFVFSLVVAPT